MTTTYNEYQYLSLMRKILAHGNQRGDRTGVGTKGLFGEQLKFDLKEGFPLLTTKKMFTKGIIHELLWFLKGDTNVKYLQDHGVKIWDDWATKEQCARFGREEGDLGPVYGWAWRDFGSRPVSFSVKDDGKEVIRYEDGVDQIAKLIDGLRNNPTSRRHIVSAWHAREADRVALPPCHTMFQCYVDGEDLSLHMYQRSADYFLGVPFNIASYAILTHMLAVVADLKPSKLIISFGDVHVYNNHFEQCKEQLSRDIMPAPRLYVSPDVSEIEHFEYDDIRVYDYEHHSSIKAPIAV